MTRIIIAHHRETIAAADRVLRLENGRVLGTEAAELLLRRIGGDTSKPVVKKLQPELRIRESCGFALHVSTLPEEKKS